MRHDQPNVDGLLRARRRRRDEQAGKSKQCPSHGGLLWGLEQFDPVNRRRPGGQRQRGPVNSCTRAPLGAQRALCLPWRSRNFTTTTSELVTTTSTGGGDSDVGAAPGGSTVKGTWCSKAGQLVPSVK